MSQILAELYLGFVRIIGNTSHSQGLESAFYLVAAVIPGLIAIIWALVS